MTQQDVHDFINDPENIKKAVEGSMDKRIKVLDSTKSQTDNTEWLDDIISTCNFEPEEYGSRICKWCGTAKGVSKHTAKQAIQAKLKEQDIKSRIDELHKLKQQEKYPFYSDEAEKYIIDRLNQLEAKTNE